MQFYSYRFMVSDDYFNHVHCARDIYQQFSADVCKDGDRTIRLQTKPEVFAFREVHPSWSLHMNGYWFGYTQKSE